MFNDSEIIIKVFNNNIVLVNSEKEEKILFGKGIGFGRKAGDNVPDNIKIDKVFTIEDKANRDGLKYLVNEIDEDFIGICEEGIYEISKLVDKQFNERIHIGLVDHLYYAVKRLKNGDEIENPFLVETKTLYKEEFKLAGILAKRIEEQFGIAMPEGEIGFITLHIHTALNDGNIQSTVRKTYLNNRIVEYVERKLGRKLDRESMDYARFCAHIKFAIQRIMSDKVIPNKLAGVIKSTYKESYEISKGISKIIEEELNISVSDDETSYITIHVERFRENSNLN